MIVILWPSGIWMVIVLTNEISNIYEERAFAFDGLSNQVLCNKC